jgi:plasmid stabilization system protein ParE
MRIAIDDAALGDLAGIYAWIADRGPESAASVLDQIFEAIECLGRMPQIGHAGRVKDSLEWVVTAYSYVIVYELARANDRLVVIGIFRGTQEIRRP